MEQRVQRQPKAADPPLSLRDQAYLEINRRSNRLEYRPGAYLNEAQISRQLKIGRTPVHQALDRLMLEGLVQVIPRKGAVVQSISLEEVLQILEARLVNELYCIGLTVERATNRDIARMQEVLATAGPLNRARDREKLINLDGAFHRLIFDAAHNAIVANILTMLHETVFAVLVHHVGRRLATAAHRRRTPGNSGGDQTPGSRGSRSGDALTYRFLAQTHHARDLTGVLRHAAYRKRAS